MRVFLLHSLKNNLLPGPLELSPPCRPLSQQGHSPGSWVLSVQCEFHSVFPPDTCSMLAAKNQKLSDQAASDLAEQSLIQFYGSSVTA